jgi:cytochrome c
MKNTFIISILTSAALFVAACGGSETSTQTKTTSTTSTFNSESSESKPAISIPEDIEALLSKNTCLTCHAVETKLVGPAFKEVALKNYTPEQMVELIHKPKPENWPGYAPMAPLPDVPAEDIIKIANWINTLK